MRQRTHLHFVTIFCALFGLLCSFPLEPTPVQASSHNALSMVDELPLSFVPNMGQADALMRYQVRSLGGILAFTTHEVTLALPAQQTDTAGEAQSTSLSSLILHLQFQGANAAAEISGLNPLPGKVNYFLGNDPAHWHTDMPTYSSLVYQQLYPGIDLRYDGTEGLLKGSYLVAPHANPSVVQWRYAGAEQIGLDATTGDLQITLPGGSVLAERAPTAWQTVNGQNIPVAIGYQLAADGSIGFTLGNYDPAYALTLDPTLAYSTYLGGTDVDAGRDIALDSSGNIIIVGDTLSTDFPIVNPLRSTPADTDVFIVKIDPSGSQLLYATYLGGTARDNGFGVTVDSSDNVYVAGQTYSDDFPAVNAFQSTFSGPSNDGFIAKLNASGSALLYSTYLGGNQQDLVLKIAVDAASRMYVTGTTTSTDFPTLNPYQALFQGGVWDIFVTAFQADGASLIYSTYLGGDQMEIVGDIAADSSGNVYLAGYSSSLNFPVKNALQTTNGNPTCTTGLTACEDAIYAKFDPSGTVDYAAYLGGDNSDEGSGVAIDSDGNIYITGSTASSDFPLFNALQATNPGTSAFVTKIDSTGSSLVYSTYLGGGGEVTGGIAVNNAGSAIVVGNTTSSAFPMVEPFQGTKQGSAFTSDLYIAKLDPSGSALLYSSYLGGSQNEGSYYAPGRIALDTLGNAYITSETSSSDLPLAAPYQNTFGGVSDGFIAKITSSPLVVNNSTDNDDGICSLSDCSLREAINLANESPDTTTITFNIPGSGVHTIQPVTMFPPITSPVIIDGTTQPGYNGAPLIELDGSLVPTLIPANGLWIQAGDSTVKGLIINNFTFGGITLEGGSGTTIVANYIGTDSTGTQAKGNRDGIYIYDSTDNTVGGLTAADRNIISGNHDDGVNFAGDTGGDSNTVEGNYIGTDVTGTQPLGNQGDGIKISEESDNNLMGGTDPAAANVIAYNQGRGVYGETVTVYPSGNRIWGNRIFSNNELGIDLAGDGVSANDAGDADIGPNNLQNFPVITDAQPISGGILLGGTLNSTPNETFRLEFFANVHCDPSGNGEGETYLGFTTVSTDGSGNASFSGLTLSGAVIEGVYVTATATDPNHNTSEFSSCLLVSSSANAAPGRNYFTTHTPTLTWNPVSWATHYELQVDDNQDFSSNEFHPLNLPPSPLYVTTDSLPSGTYYWHVRAIGANGKPGAWSATERFIIYAP